jgi:microcystin-dependent protein
MNTMSSPYVGEIRMFGGNFAPVGWAFCNGATMPISENDALFNLIGTTYGGDGQVTFNLPNLQSRLPMHQGTGPGLSPRTIGEAGGVETVTLTTQQIPTHSHAPLSISGNGNQTTPQNGVWAGVATSIYTSNAPNTAFNNTLGGSAGGSQPHDNMMPYLAINFIISLFGIYPSPT